MSDEAVRAKGEALFHRSDSKRNIIACAIGHGDDGRGQDRLGVASITKLSPEYGDESLHEFRAAPGYSIPHADAMRITLHPMNTQDLKAVATYVRSVQK